MRVYVCGNPLVKEDSLPLRMLPLLRKAYPHIEFVDFDPTEDIPKEDPLIIIDTVINAKDAKVFTDIDAFCTTKALSIHDFDLGMNLKLAKKMGRLDAVEIIGIPANLSPQEAMRKVSPLLSGLASRSAKHSSCRDHTRG